MKTILNDIDKIQPWLINYLLGRLKYLKSSQDITPMHLFFCLCDHFEPLVGGADKQTGMKRIKKWVNNYPKIADRYRDSDGLTPKHTFFYPIEEYDPDYMDMLADLCHKGYGEVEIHLHHKNDSAENLKVKISDFKEIMVRRHKLLSKDKSSGEIGYGFIHGNWGLDNSGGSERCGVNNELEILQDTGCYADFTMPSAPDNTQTDKINSIYYAIDDPDKPKSHNCGIDACSGNNNKEGLLCVQGPLMLNWKKRKYGLLPRIENSNISKDDRVCHERIKLWIAAAINLKNSPEYIFVKVHTHGCYEDNSRYLFDEGGFKELFKLLKDNYDYRNFFRLHYVSAREMVNVIKALEENRMSKDFTELRNHKFINVWGTYE
jgi:hypothetical protein